MRKSILMLISLLATTLLLGAIPEAAHYPNLKKNQVHSPGIFDGNRIHANLENNGMIVSHRLTGHSGLEWPQGEDTYSVYAAGLWFAGKVNGQIRTAVAEYGPEFTPGAWGADGNDPADKLYKVNISDLPDPEANPDFATWPVHQGAPWVDEDGDGVYTPLPDGPDHPDFIGDQVIYYVMHDGIQDNHGIFNTEPLGIEVHVTIWGYSADNTFADMLFFKSQLYNRGGNTIDSLHFGVWADPDLGNAVDDWVGCDTGRNLGFCYNDGSDNTYGAAAPAVGFDLLQIAVPSEDPADEQYCFDQLLSGYQNMPMQTFLKYECGGAFCNPNTAQQAYYNMMGLDHIGSPIINPASGGVTTLMVSGDPQLNVDDTDQIWVDSDDSRSGDRYMYLGSGPFTLNPSDSAEIILTLLHGQGSTSINSITALKYNSDIAQAHYNNHFAPISAPPEPELRVTALSGEIILEWEPNAELLRSGYEHSYQFEGYNIYQHTGPDSTSARILLATFDLKNGVTQIWDNVFNSDFGEIIFQPIQYGTDSGIQRFLVINEDALNRNASLIDDREYYYSVTAYAYNGALKPTALESNSTIQSVRPQTDIDQTPGMDIESDITVSHTGLADAAVELMIINPYLLTGETYEIYFDQQHYYQLPDETWAKTTDTSSASGHEYETISHWNLRNSTGTVLLEDQTILNGVEYHYITEAGVLTAGSGDVGTTSLPVIDGFQLNVVGSYAVPEKETFITHVGNGSYDWASQATFGWAATSWAIDTYGYGTSNIDLLQQDYEIRWTGEYGAVGDVNGDGSLLYHTIKDGTGSLATWIGAQNYLAVDHPDYNGNDYFQIRIPFEVWNLDTDEQISVIIYDRRQNPGEGGDFFAFNPNDRMYFLIWNEAYDESVVYADAVNGEYLTWNLISWSSEWVTGDVSKITYANPLQLGKDTFSFTTIAPTMKNFDSNLIKVWPNPYMGRNPEQQGQHDHRIHFINLPDQATINIYSLAGQLVRVLDHSGSQQAVWDIRNYENRLVASGMYIAVITTDAGQHILKLAVIIPNG